MKLQFVGHGTEPVGVAAPIVTQPPHEQWLVPPMFVPVTDPSCCMVLTPGQFLDLHEIRDRHWIQWMGSHPDFRRVNSQRHPELYS